MCVYNNDRDDDNHNDSIWFILDQFFSFICLMIHSKLNWILFLWMILKCLWHGWDRWTSEFFFLPLCLLLGFFKCFLLLMIIFFHWFDFFLVVENPKLKTKNKRKIQVNHYQGCLECLVVWSRVFWVQYFKWNETKLKKKHFDKSINRFATCLFLVVFSFIHFG